MCHATSPLPQFMHYVPAPPQFMSPGAISSDSLMLMSPDYSAVYHPLTVPPQDVVGLRTLDTNRLNNNSNLDVLQQQHQQQQQLHRNSGKSTMAESSFSSSSCSSGSTRPPSHNNSTTSTMPVACMSSSSCSCSSSTCQYQRSAQHRRQEEECEDQQLRNAYPFDVGSANMNNVDRLMMVGHPSFAQIGYPIQPTSVRRSGETIKTEDDNSGFGIFTSLWRKHKSKTSGRRDSGRSKMTSSSTTIFRLEPNHPSYPRFSAGPNAQVVIGTPLLCHNNSLIRQNIQINSDGNGNPAPLSLGVHLAPSSSSYNQNQRFSFNAAAQSNINDNSRLRQPDLINGRCFGTTHYGTPTLGRMAGHGKQAPAAHFHGTLSNRRRKPKRPEVAGSQGHGAEDSEEESARLLLLPADEVWKPLSSATLGKQATRVSGNQGVMPNPDDILPKQAWTDFSGTDEWPNLILDEKECSDLQVEKLNRSRRGKKSREAETEDRNSEVYVNVDRPPTPPKPKERRLGPKPNLEAEDVSDRSPDEQVEELVYESLVDDDDSAHFMRSNEEHISNGKGEVTNDQIESKEKKSFDSKTSSLPEKEKKLIVKQEETFPRPPTQTFRSTKFISVTNSPKSHMSPMKSPAPLDR